MFKLDQACSDREDVPTPEIDTQTSCSAPARSIFGSKPVIDSRR